MSFENFCPVYRKASPLLLLSELLLDVDKPGNLLLLLLFWFFFKQHRSLFGFVLKII